MPIDNENFTITIQASGKSAETLLAKMNYNNDIDAIGQVVLRIAELEKLIETLRISVNASNTVTIKEECVPNVEVVELPAVVIAMSIPPCPPLEHVEEPLAGRKRPWSEVEEVVEEEVVEVIEEVVEEEEEVVEEEEVEEVEVEVIEEVVEEEEEVIEEEEEVIEEVVEEEEEEDVSEGAVGGEALHEEDASEGAVGGKALHEEDVSEGGVGGEALHEEEEEEEELELEEFEYDYRTYYKDQNNLIYTLDFDLEITEAIGEYNPKTMKITFYKE
jgi:hypothetical protein